MKFIHNAISDHSDPFPQKRKHPRRESDQCVAEINGKTYPILNWSQSGALIFADDRFFGENDDIALMLKFHNHDHILSIPANGKIIRKRAGRIAVQFDPEHPDTRRHLQQVIDDIATREFTDSQI